MRKNRGGIEARGEPVGHECGPARWGAGKAFDPLGNQGPHIKLDTHDGKTIKEGRLDNNRARHKVPLTFPEKIECQRIKLLENPSQHVDK